MCTYVRSICTRLYTPFQVEYTGCRPHPVCIHEYICVYIYIQIYHTLTVIRSSLSPALHSRSHWPANTRSKFWISRANFTLCKRFAGMHMQCWNKDMESVSGTHVLLQYIALCVAASASQRWGSLIGLRHPGPGACCRRDRLSQGPVWVQCVTKINWLRIFTYEYVCINKYVCIYKDRCLFARLLCTNRYIYIYMWI